VPWRHGSHRLRWCTQGYLRAGRSKLQRAFQRNRTKRPCFQHHLAKKMQVPCLQLLISSAQSCLLLYRNLRRTRLGANLISNVTFQETINVARNIDDIQRDIERTRRQLASTLDELADRSKPANLANDAKAAATEKLSQQNVQIALASVAALVVGAIAFSVVRSRRKSNDLKELQRLLSQR